MVNLEEHNTIYAAWPASNPFGKFLRILYTILEAMSIVHNNFPRHDMHLQQNQISEF